MPSSKLFCQPCAASRSSWSVFCSVNVSTNSMKPVSARYLPTSSSSRSVIFVRVRNRWSVGSSSLAVFLLDSDCHLSFHLWPFPQEPLDSGLDHFSGSCSSASAPWPLLCCPSTFGGERPPQTWCISCRATEAWLSSIATTEAGCLAVSRISQSKLKQDWTVLHMCSRVLVLRTAIRAGSGRGQASARAQTVGGGFVLPVFRVHQPAVLLNPRTLERNPLVTVHAVFSKHLLKVSGRSSKSPSRAQGLQKGAITDKGFGCS